MRIKSHWYQNGREKTPQQIADALAFVIWRIGDNALKDTRKANFEIEVGEQYFTFLGEFLIFLILVADRITYRQLSAEQRAMFTGTLANRVGDTFAENESRLLEGDFSTCKQGFIDRINLRSGEYAEFGYDESGPDYGFMRYLAYCIGEGMDEKDRFWITDQIISIEAPAAIQRIDKTLCDLTSTTPRAARPARPVRASVIRD
jgi:hypothetical protein